MAAVDESMIPPVMPISAVALAGASRTAGDPPFGSGAAAAEGSETGSVESLVLRGPRVTATATVVPLRLL